MSEGSRQRAEIPAEVIEEIDQLLAVKGRPYLRLSAGEMKGTDCFQWSERESMPEILNSISSELAKWMAASQEKMSGNPFSGSDPMQRMREHIAKHAPHILEEYDLFVDRLEQANRSLLNPTGEERPSLPEEIKATAERIAAQASSEWDGGQFDLEAYLQRAQELWQREPPEVQAVQKRYQEELVEYQTRLQEVGQSGEDRLAAVRAHLHGRPFTAYGDVIVAPTDNQYDVLRIEETNGANYGLQTEDLIRWLRGIEERYGLQILDAGFDFVRFELGEVPAGEDALELMADLLQLCPDLEGEDDPLGEGVVQLWWD